MSHFAFYALILTVVAAAIILRPFLRQPGLTAGTLTLTAAAIAAAIGLYSLVGTPSATEPLADTQTETAPPTLEQAIAELEQRLNAQPGDVEGWVLLAQAERTRNNYARATEALQRARELAPDNPNILVDLAQARSFAQGQRQLDERSRELLADALQLNPDHQRGLFLAGVAAVQAGETEQARAHWQHLLALLPPDSDVASAVSEQMQALGMDTGSSLQTLPVRVEIDPALAGKAPENATLFVFARAAGQGGMPLAVVRKPMVSLPVEIDLPRNRGMAGGPALAGVERFDLIARLSLSGGAQASAGDLEGRIDGLEDQTKAVRIVIDTIVSEP